MKQKGGKHLIKKEPKYKAALAKKAKPEKAVQYEEAEELSYNYEDSYEKTVELSPAAPFLDEAVEKKAPVKVRKERKAAPKIALPEISMPKLPKAVKIILPIVLIVAIIAGGALMFVDSKLNKLSYNADENTPMKTGEEFKEALRDFIPQYILSRTDIWSTEDDKLKVVGFAEILNDLLSKAAPGTVIPDIKVKGEYIKGTRSSHKKKSLRKLSGKENIIIFHTVGCHICEAEIKAARELAAADSDVRVFLVNVDKIIEENPTLSSTLFDSFDLSALPHILQTDKEGNIQRRYISLK